MVMKKDGRKRDIKSKLVAAVCMLLVSCIMMVSSTYAWFTLSTAPEVKGITTAIGANGNLEMALLPNAADVVAALNAIDNPTDSTNKNNTWGNLVDLSDNSVYGTNLIKLYPSKLGAVSNGKLPTSFLSVPSYGPDGRVSGMNDTSISQIYANGGFTTAGYGVRAVGLSAGMSAHETAWRNAVGAAETAKNQAASAAKTAASQGGTALANLAVKKQSNATTFDQNDIANLKSAYTGLLNAITSIENALKLAIIADYMGDVSGEANFDANQTAMAGMTLYELNTATYVSDETMRTDIDALSTLKSGVQTKLTALNGMTETSYEWDDISSYVTTLADVDTMKLNGHTITEYLSGGADISGLMGAQLNMVIAANDAGYYATLADYVGTYTTSIKIDKLEYLGFEMTNISVYLTVEQEKTQAVIVVLYADAGSATVTFTSSGANISDFYGFIIDMAFRTNAAESYLQLQPDGVDRVYADNTSNPTTMGGGSTMSYSFDTDSGYNAETLKTLMSHIRLVLFNPADNTIYAYARLNVGTAVVEANPTAGTTTVTMQIELCEADGTALTDDDTTDNVNEKLAILKLAQNTATAVSTLVYLDGETLTNADVANADLTGKMNLQFSSSEKLKPMEYNDLREGNTEGNEVPEVTQVNVSESSTSGYTYNAFATEAGGITGIGVEVTPNGEVDAVTAVSIQIGEGEGEAVPATNVNGVWVVAYDGVIDSETTIIVTVNP